MTKDTPDQREEPATAGDNHLPASADHYDLDRHSYTQLMNAALPILTRYATDIPKAELNAIAEAGDVSGRHPLLKNNQLLYEEALRYALAQLWPDLEHGGGLADGAAAAGGVAAAGAAVDGDGSGASPGVMRRKNTPAHALRQLVADTMRRFQSHPHAARLVVVENLFGVADVTRRVDVMEESPVILELDRVLMWGRDLGAFRTNVSAEDVYVLILSLCGFPVTQGRVFYSLYDMNVSETHNVDGMVKLACDAVLAFLTTTMPTEQGNSYTHSSPSELVGESVASSLYDSDSVSGGFAGDYQWDSAGWEPGGWDDEGDEGDAELGRGGLGEGGLGEGEVSEDGPDSPM